VSADRDRLAAIRERLAATSPGRWTATTSYPYLVWQGKPGAAASEADGIISTSLAVEGHEAADAEFIARAHDEDVPWLLTELEAKEKDRAYQFAVAERRIARLEAEAGALRNRLAAVQDMAERADRKGYQLDPADVLDALGTHTQEESRG
jgi:hypothetical protein